MWIYLLIIIAGIVVALLWQGFLGIIIVVTALVCLLMYTHKALKERNNKNVSTTNNYSPRAKKIDSKYYYQLLNTAIYVRLDNNQETIMSFYTKENKDRITELFREWKYLFQQYIFSTLNLNLIPTKPMSSTNAAILGSVVGGNAVGMAAAIDAEKKQDKYERDYANYLSKEDSKRKSNNAIENCFLRIEGVIGHNEDAKEYWEKEKQSVIEEHQRKYRLK